MVCGAGDLSRHALTGVVCIGEGPEYRPFSDLRSVPEGGLAKGAGRNSRKDMYSSLLRKVALGFFHFLEIVTCWLVPSAGQKIPVQHDWYLPPQKIPLAENIFLQQARELKIQRKDQGSALRICV